MKGLFRCCFTNPVAKISSKQRRRSQKSGQVMETSRWETESDNAEFNQQRNDTISSNIVSNHDFSSGLHSWRANCCHAYVKSAESACSEGVVKPDRYAVITNRTEPWQGLEQVITNKISSSTSYSVSAIVRASGPLHDSTDVIATLKLINHSSETRYLFIGKTSVSKERWEKLEGTFSLSTMPDKAVFYLEGPSPGVDLHISSVVITCSSLNKSEDPASIKSTAAGDEDIIINPTFEDGLNNWSARGCKIMLHDSMADGKIFPKSGKVFVAATERTQTWNGIQQDITARVQRKLAYEVTAVVRIYSNNVSNATVQVTLWVLMQDQSEQYIGIANVQATDKDWTQFQGKFLLNGSPSKVVIYIEGPPPGTDILVKSMTVKHAENTRPAPRPVIEFNQRRNDTISSTYTNIVTNHDFSSGLLSWRANCCNAYLKSAESTCSEGMVKSDCHAVITNRTKPWQGLEQDITNKISSSTTYSVSAIVRASGPLHDSTDVIATLKLINHGSETRYLFTGKTSVSKERWESWKEPSRYQPCLIRLYFI